MAATVDKYTDALRGLSVEEKEKFLKNKNRWQLVVAGEKIPTGTDWRVFSPFGDVLGSVVVKDGNILFDRPMYRESSNTNVVAYGRDDGGKTKIAVIKEFRPHADDPERPGQENSPMLFGQIPMGFMINNVTGEKIFFDYEESVKDSAVDQVGKKTGGTLIKNVSRPAFPWHNPNPTFVGTWSNLIFLEVDLDQIEELKQTHHEQIFKAEYVTVKELFRRIKEGRDEDGAIYRACTSNSLWMIFFATFPELLRELD